MEPLNKRITTIIKQKKLQPKPKWQISLVEILRWVVFGLGLVLSGVLVAIIINVVNQEEAWAVWQMRRNITLLISAIPIVWILCVALLSVLLRFEFKHTKHGYKITGYKIIGIVMAASLVLGLVFSVFNITAYLPALVHTIRQPEQYWSQPQAGLLSGTILSIDHQTLTLRDWSGTVWHINITSATTVRGRVQLVPNEQIKIMGQLNSENIFVANDIRPWLPGRRLVK
ncbi:MAG: hypothetical protein WCW27_03905 [Patescibacteria group bacterium]|jgi:MFS family permease